MIGNNSIIATNRKAHHDYFIMDRYEAGIVLKGNEVKSLRTGKGVLSDAYVTFKGEEAFIVNMHIPQYATTVDKSYDPTGLRKLLMHKSELLKLFGTVKQKGFALIPLKVYFKKGMVKLQIAVCKGKRKYDKRQSLKKKEHDREIERGMRRK